MTDEDLVYDGRARKRPPGANSTVIEIFDLLDTHPDGMTIEEVVEALRLGFPTDAYRAYESRLQNQRGGGKRRTEGPPVRRLPPLRLQYGTPEFKRHAEYWWVRNTLYDMAKARSGTALRIGDKWYRGERAPLVQIVCEAGKRHMVPYDSKNGRAEDEARVRRANIREDARVVLSDKRLSAKARKVIEQLMEMT